MKKILASVAITAMIALQRLAKKLLHPAVVALERGRASGGAAGGAAGAGAGAAAGAAVGGIAAASVAIAAAVVAAVVVAATQDDDAVSTSNTPTTSSS